MKISFINLNISINKKPISNNKKFFNFKTVAFDTVSFSGKKNKQMIGKYSEQLVTRRLLKKGCAQKTVQSVLENPKKRQMLVDFIENFEKGDINFSRTPREREIILALDEEFSNEKLQNLIEYQDNKNETDKILTRPLKTNEALYAIKNNASLEQIQRALTLSDKDKDGKTFLSVPLTFQEGIYAALNDYTDVQAEMCYSLEKKHNFWGKKLVENKNSFEKLVYLTNKPDLKRPLTLIEAANVVERKFDDKQINRFLELQDNDYTNSFDEKMEKPCLRDIFAIIYNDFSDFQTYHYLRNKDKSNLFPIIKDEEKLKEFLNLTGEYGELKTSRPLTYDEAIHIFDAKKNFSIPERQEYINLLDKGCNRYFAKNFVEDFFEYKDVRDIQKLTLQERKALLKKIVSKNTILFDERIKITNYPLVPKTKDEYCKMVPMIANSIGMSVQKMSKKDKQKFDETLSSLIAKIEDSNIKSDSIILKKDLNKIFSILFGVNQALKNQDLKKEALLVLDNVIKTPEFKKLNQEDKKVLAIATLLHNIGKNNDNDFLPCESAFDAFYVIQKLDLKEDNQLKIYEIIKNQNWFDSFDNKNTCGADFSFENDDSCYEKIAQDIAFETRHSNTFTLSKMLSVSIAKNNGRALDDLFSRAKLVEKYLKKLQNTQIFLPQAKFPKASEIKHGKVIKTKNIKNIVLDLSECDNELSKYGFEKGTTKQNLFMLVHGLDYPDQLSNFSSFSIIDNEAILSASYMNLENHKVFRPQGVILDVNTNDILAGYFKDFGSGCRKDVEKVKKRYIFSNNANSEIRTYISDLLKKKLNLTDEKYVDLVANLKNFKSLPEIEKISPKFAKIFKTVFDEMEFGKRSYSRQYNEFLVSKPKIQAVFSYGQDYEKIPEFLKIYAMENDLPIILFGK